MQIDEEIVNVVDGGRQDPSPTHLLKPGSITFNLNGESWECTTIKSIQELVAKLYANRDEYLRKLERQINSTGN